MRELKPILRNIKAVADGSGFTLMATDLEMGIRHEMRGLRIDDQGEAILPAAKITQIDPPNATVDFTVLARAAGSFPLDVRLETPDGTRLIGRGSVILRSSAVSAVALLVVAGSTVFLLLAWARRTRRRTQAAAGVSTAAPPADTA